MEYMDNDQNIDEEIEYKDASEYTDKESEFKDVSEYMDDNGQVEDKRLEGCVELEDCSWFHKFKEKYLRTLYAILGIGMIATIALESSDNNIPYLMEIFMVLLCIRVVFLGISLIAENCVVISNKNKRCNVTIQALSQFIVSENNGKMYMKIYSYSFKDRDYKVKIRVSEYVARKFNRDEYVTLYINPNCPNEINFDKDISMINRIVLSIIGIVLCSPLILALVYGILILIQKFLELILYML